MHPPHPKRKAIAKMISEMRPLKYMTAELKLCPKVIRRQAEGLGCLKIYLTQEERLWLAAKRGISKDLVP